MTAVPAQAAGVGEIAVVAPPTQFGSYDNDLLATCHELGRRGYQLHEVDLTPFMLSGGGAYCMTLRLDRSSGPGIAAAAA